MNAKPDRLLLKFSDEELIAEIALRDMSVGDIFPDHCCEDNLDDFDYATTIETLTDNDALKADGELFGVQLAYEHACAGDAQSAAKALNHAVPALRSIDQQKRLQAEYLT